MHRNACDYYPIATGVPTPQVPHSTPMTQRADRLHVFDASPNDVKSPGFDFIAEILRNAHLAPSSQGETASDHIDTATIGNFFKQETDMARFGYTEPLLAREPPDAPHISRLGLRKHFMDGNKPMKNLTTTESTPVAQDFAPVNTIRISESSESLKTTLRSVPIANVQTDVDGKRIWDPYSPGFGVRESGRAALFPVCHESGTGTGKRPSSRSNATKGTGRRSAVVLVPFASNEDKLLERQLEESWLRVMHSKAMTKQSDDVNPDTKNVGKIYCEKHL